MQTFCLLFLVMNDLGTKHNNTVMAMYLTIMPGAVLLLMIIVSIGGAGGEAFDQELPDCRTQYPVITKQTTKTALTCAMIRNEEGFLAEWIAFHQMHGFDHIILFDHESSDAFRVEIKPWLDSGFVTVYSDWEPILKYNPKTKTSFLDKMDMKIDLENFCKQRGVEMKMDYFASLDMDEYLMPRSGMITTVDALHQHFESRKSNIIRLGKLNFQASPHSLEPVNLLTLEAYHMRMEYELKMTYFKKVGKKLAMQLNGYGYTNRTRMFLLNCCSLHGCGRGGPLCKSLKSELSIVFGEQIKKRGENSLVIYHYSRSLEKFGLKAKTWETASGGDVHGYNIVHFLDRNVGRFTDRSALRFTCQLRHHLANWTGERPFFRSGDMWYRNVEFGRPMHDKEKGRRSGAVVERGFQLADSRFPDHYFGYYTALNKYEDYHKNVIRVV